MTDESFEDHPEVHPEPEPDCHLCTLVALTRVSMRVVELEAENEALRGQIRAVQCVCVDCALEHDNYLVVPVEDIRAALDGEDA